MRLNLSTDRRCGPINSSGKGAQGLTRWRPAAGSGVVPATESRVGSYLVGCTETLSAAKKG